AFSSRAVIAGHGPSSKARRAAFTARSTSPAVAMAKRPISSLAAGFTWVHISPPDESTHFPSMNRRPSTTLSSSRFGSTEIAMCRSPLVLVPYVLSLDDVDVVSAPHAADARAHRVGSLALGHVAGL